MTLSYLLRPPKTVTITTITGTCLCPFCLHEAPTDKYVISTKKGFHKSLGQCPNCKVKSQYKSLTTKWTPESFADWCHTYSADGFWQKVSYSQFNEGLRRKGWLDRFWTRYKELKGEGNENESYTDYIERKQREEYEGG